MIAEMMPFILENFKDKFELTFFFKTCFFNVNVEIVDFKNILFGMGKAYRAYKSK
jgi:hypothetical protein